VEDAIMENPKVPEVGWLTFPMLIEVRWWKPGMDYNLGKLPMKMKSGIGTRNVLHLLKYQHKLNSGV